MVAIHLFSGAIVDMFPVDHCLLSWCKARAHQVIPPPVLLGEGGLLRPDRLSRCSILLLFSLHVNYYFPGCM